MRGEYAKKGCGKMFGRSGYMFPLFVTIRWYLALPDVAPMFSVDENSSSFFFFPALLPLLPYLRLFYQ